MTLEIGLILLFLMAAVLFYSIFGGADFGMGVMEILLKKKVPDCADITKKVIGPVWEANHVWLVIVIVMLFIAFPKAFSALCIYAHIPLFLVLVGIVIRGCAFSFRHYDPFKDRSHLLHDQLFRWSSMITPFFFGVTMASLVHIFPAQGTYFERYVSPFLEKSSVLGGLFFMVLFAHSAWMLLMSECPSYGLKQKLSGWKKAMTGLTLGVAGLTFYSVFVTHHYHHFTNPIVVGSFGLGVASLLVPFFSLHRWVLRGALACLHLSILGTFIYLVFPVIIRTSDQSYTWINSAAPSQVLRILITTLTVGMIIIIPNLVLLFKVFKSAMKDA